MEAVSGGVYLMTILGIVPLPGPASEKVAIRWLLASRLADFDLLRLHPHLQQRRNLDRIFSAAAIGFVFCVSVRLTGSAWWAIGFHAAWDWTQTFFYGTADSGIPAKGHFLTTTPAGVDLWSGGSDGPEGSLLVIPVILLVLVVLILVYGRRMRAESPSPAAQPQLS